MNKKKKKNKNTVNNSILLLLIPIILIVIIIGLAFGKILRAENKEYRIVSRLEQAQKAKVGESGALKTVGWIKVEGTNIDLPIVFNESAKSYPVEVKGYAWMNNLDSKFHNNIEIMGHNIFNLSSNPQIKSNDFERFEELLSFVYYDKAKENQYIQLTLDGKEYVYKIFGVGFVPSAVVASYPFSDDYTKEEMDRFLKTNEEFNIYDYDIDVNKDDKIISLVTCTHFFGTDMSYEFRVFGRLVRDGEKMTKYTVHKNKNYETIEKTMKGVEKDEDEKA